MGLDCGNEWEGGGGCSCKLHTRKIKGMRKGAMEKGIREEGGGGKKNRR